MACDGNGNQTQFSLVLLLRPLLARMSSALSTVRTIRRHVVVTHIRYHVQFLLFRLFRTQKPEHESDNTRETILSEMEHSNRGWPFRYIVHMLQICAHHSRRLSTELLQKLLKTFPLCSCCFLEQLDLEVFICNFKLQIALCIKYYELFRHHEPRLERPSEIRITNCRCVSNCGSIENESRKQNDSIFLFDKFGRSDEINLTVSALVVVVLRLSFIRGRIYLTSRTLYLKYLFYFTSFLRFVYVTVCPWARVFTIEYPCALCARCAAECRRYYHICLFVWLIGIDFFLFSFFGSRRYQCNLRRCLRGFYPQ